VKELLPLVDVFLPNEAEALAIAGESETEKAGEALAHCGPLVVIKRGREGATAFHQGRRWHIPAEDPEGQIVDSVGAGDNFDAGFVRAWQLGWPVEDCLRLATRCARASLRESGGVRGQLQENPPSRAGH
jgi:sugar/nucleoside kinase (ribokinase family)